MSMENRKELEERIEQLTAEKRYAELKAELSEINPADLAGTLEELSDELQPLVFRLLPKEQAAETFAYLDNEVQESLIEAFNEGSRGPHVSG